MADIKLSYFDARGRAELSRLILAYAGVSFSSKKLGNVTVSPIDLIPGGLHGPAIVRGPVCVGEGEASLGPAAGSQVQRHHACSIHDYRKVKTPGYKKEQTPDTIFYPNQVPCN